MEAVKMRLVDPKTPERQRTVGQEGADLSQRDAAFAHVDREIAELAGAIEIGAELELSAELLRQPIQQRAAKLAQKSFIAAGPRKRWIGLELRDDAPCGGAIEPDKKLAPGGQAVDERAPTCERVGHVVQNPQALDDVKATGKAGHRRQLLNVALPELDVAGAVALRHLACISESAGGEVNGRDLGVLSAERPMHRLVPGAASCDQHVVGLIHEGNPARAEEGFEPFLLLARWRPAQANPARIGIGLVLARDLARGLVARSEE